MQDGLLHQAGNATHLAAGDQALDSGQASERCSSSCCLSTAGRQSRPADSVAVRPWLPCSRRRCVHQVTGCMLPNVLIPDCCRLLMSCSSSRLLGPLHFAAPFDSAGGNMASALCVKVGHLFSLLFVSYFLARMTSFNFHGEAPGAATQPAPYTCRLAHVSSAISVCSGSRLLPCHTCSEQCTTSKGRTAPYACSLAGLFAALLKSSIRTVVQST